MKLMTMTKGANGRWRVQINLFSLYFTLSNTPVRFRSRQDKFLSQNDRRNIKLGLMTRRGNGCELCGRTGDEASIELHHIKPIMTHPELAKADDNIMLLCHECHAGIHREMFENETLIKK